MTSSPRAARMRSLDILRGFTIAGMILVNNPGSEPNAYPVLRHALWNGWTFADVIFPMFLWMVGVSMTLSTSSRIERGYVRRELLGHAVGRAMQLYAIGIALMALGFSNPRFPYVSIDTHIRLAGILQKIAVCYLFAFLIFLWADWRGVVAGIVALNLAYLGLMFFYPVPGCGPGSWSIDCNFVRYFDQTLLKGHMWHQSVQDPDGLGAIFPAISSVLFGVLAGHLLRRVADPAGRTMRLLLMGGVLVAAGAVLSVWIPINKPLWTTSYAFLMAGLSAVGFAACYWLADAKGLAERFKPFEVFGMNAIAAFIISVVAVRLPKVGAAEHWLYRHVWLAVTTPANASLIYALLNVLGVYGVVWFMYRRGWFLKL